MNDWLSGLLPDNEHTRHYLKEFPAMAEEYRRTPIAVLPFSLFRLFHDTGSRVEYEDAYFDHRKRLNVFLLLTLSGKWEYLPDLEDILAAVCEEYTWVLPAHQREDADPAESIGRIDLFSSETAFALSETLHLIGDRLHPTLRRRMRHELRRRIVEPYLLYHREWGANNWSAVCAAGVLATFIYLGLDDEFEAARGPLTGSLDKFLGSFAEDGCCTEGPLYWQYGFGFFCYGAALLRDYTHGEIDYFKDPKVHAIATYGAGCHMTENFVLPFADTPHRWCFDMGLDHFLRRQYPELPGFDPTWENIFGDEARYRTPEILRNLYWYDEKLTADAVLLPRVDFPVSRQYVRNRAGYSFGCKGGHNDEPHNHNDLGAFFVLKDGQFLLDDPGSCEYDKYYFKKDHRYRDYLCAMSQGHCVPILNGAGQMYGREFSAETVSCEDDCVVLDLSRAYDIPGLRFVRTFRLEERAVEITDEIAGADTVTERFVTRILPEQSADGFTIADARLIGENCRPELNSEQFISPLRDADRTALSREPFSTRKLFNGGMSLEETLYLMDFRCPGSGTYRFRLEW